MLLFKDKFLITRHETQPYWTIIRRRWYSIFWREYQAPIWTLQDALDRVHYLTYWENFDVQK